MAPFRFEYTRTPTDEPSFTEKSWKGSSNTLVAECGTEDRESKKSRFWVWWNRTPKQDVDSPMNWKPLSMTTPILSAVIVASLLMVAGIELLAQKSQKQGGLALSPSLDEIPQLAMISAQYFPQVLAVFYSLVWSWVDLDIKRMQPWFEMSKPEGATAQDSLLLDYPYTFVAWVPFKASKRKHWMVFLSGTAMVLVFWAVTPLQSAQLGTGAVNLDESRHIVNRSRLAPLENQESLLGPEILNTGYAVGWLEQSFPPFMTAERAFLPFYVDDTDVPAKSGANWTASTTELSTELDCWPAEYSRNGFNESLTFGFQNGQGCNASLNMPASSADGTVPHAMFYIGYYNSPYGTFWLDSPTCPPTEKSTHQFLAVWTNPVESSKEAGPAGDTFFDFEFNAQYCQTSYYKQEVLITVNADSLEPYPDTAEAISNRELLSESEFNTTAFEFLLSNGMPQEIKNRDHPYTFQVEQHPRIKDFNLTMPVSNMVGFALAGEDSSTADFPDPEYIHDIFIRAHRYLFSLAVNQVLVNETTSANQTATATFPMHGIIVSRAISAALEALLLLVAVFTAVIIWLCHKSPLNLRVNPSSISRVIEIFRDSPQLLDSFCTVDNADEKSLWKSASNEKFRLIWNENQQCHEIVLRKGPIIDEKRKAELQKGYYEPIRPLALRLGSGIAFVVAIIGVMAGLSYLKWAEVEFTGLKRPSPNKEVQQILENYIPTILSTLIEPFWVLVNRLLCVLQPFKDLWVGGANPDSSISSTYTSIPPQFVVWRAIKSRHYVLSMVCSAVFLANILTVSLPAVFKEGDVTVKYTVAFTSEVSTIFNNQSVVDFLWHLSNDTIASSAYQDHTYAALANMSSGTTLPPWVTVDFYFQPWDNINGSNNSVDDTYSIVTHGFGVETNCTSVPISTLPVDERIKAPSNPNDTFCGDFLAIAATQIRESQAETSSGRSAQEYSGTPTGRKVSSCDQTLTLGWARTPDSDNINATIEASFAICHPIFRTAMFNVEVDNAGYVQSYNRTSSLESTLEYSGSEIHIEKMIANANNILSMAAEGWHNDTVSRDWINHLLIITRGSRDIIDPHEPVPNPDDLIPDIDTIYRELFSLLLALQRTYVFEKSTGDQTAVGKRIVSETRLFLNQPAFIISMVLLGFNIVVAVLFYTQGVVFVLPRMPTSLGSIVAYVAPSRIVDEADSKTLALRNKTFSFGRFLGRDGDTHVGIEMDPYVVHIDPASLGKSTKSWFKFQKSRKRMGKSMQDGPWL